MTAPGILLLAFVSPNSKGQLIFPALICWVVIYEMDGAIQPLIKWGMGSKVYSQKKFLHLSVSWKVLPSCIKCRPSCIAVVCIFQNGCEILSTELCCKDSIYFLFFLVFQKIQRANSMIDQPASKKPRLDRSMSDSNSVFSMLWHGDDERQNNSYCK